MIAEIAVYAGGPIYSAATKTGQRSQRSLMYKATSGGSGRSLFGVEPAQWKTGIRVAVMMVMS
jgi:hypothetical protein